MRIIKLRSVRKGDHIHETMFMGEENRTLVNQGTLVMNIGDWQLFGAVFLLGAKYSGDRLKVICEGEEDIFPETQHGI